MWRNPSVTEGLDPRPLWDVNLPSGWRCPVSQARYGRSLGKAAVASSGLGRHGLVESRCGAVAVDGTYLLPPLSSGGASLVPPWLRFHIPLIEPDMQISRIRLSDKTSRPYACAYFRVQRHRQFLNTHRS
jgi:hypothetical protein